MKTIIGILLCCSFVSAFIDRCGYDMDDEQHTCEFINKSEDTIVVTMQECSDNEQEQCKLWQNLYDYWSYATDTLASGEKCPFAIFKYSKRSTMVYILKYETVKTYTLNEIFEQDLFDKKIKCDYEGLKQNYFRVVYDGK